MPNLAMLDKEVAPTKPQIEELQQALSTMPQATTMVTSHYFADGMYCRKLFRQAGTLIVGKEHKMSHFFICAMGEIKVWTEKGVITLKAGDIVETMPGTKRVTYAVTDSIGITVHKTDNKN